MAIIRDRKSVGITGSVDKKLSLKFQRSQNEESNGQENREGKMGTSLSSVSLSAKWR